MQAQTFVFVSRNCELTPFFTKKAMENSHQAVAKVTPARAVIMARRLRDVEGVEDLQLMRRSYQEA